MILEKLNGGAALALFLFCWAAAAHRPVARFHSAAAPGAAPDVWGLGVPGPRAACCAQHVPATYTNRRAAGWEVYKRVDTPEFHNISYVREMLFQVFSALDRAQRKLGFHHADLGMR